MKGPRDYSAGTRAALVAFSRGTCYYPDCEAPLVVFVDNEPIVNYEIAHIRDAKPGNRYDPRMTDVERSAFANLVLLCPVHHKVVDKIHPEQFSIEELTSWKQDREPTELRELGADVLPAEQQLEALLTIAAASDRRAEQVGIIAEIARLSTSLAIEARVRRAAVEAEIGQWRAAWQQTRDRSFGLDRSTGELVYAELPRGITDEHRARVAAALSEASTAVD